MMTSWLNWSDQEFCEILQKLRTQQKDFESVQDYVEADKIEEEIKKLKNSHRAKTVRRLRQVQRRERYSIDIKYTNDKKSFDEEWEDRIKVICEKFRLQNEELDKKHAKVVEGEKKDLEKNIPFVFKPSSQLLNLIACKEAAVGSKKYREAQVMTREIQESIEFEKKVFEEQRELKIEKHLTILRQKLEKEAKALQVKQELELAQVRKVMDGQRENMGKKVDNICRELENAQNIQVNIVKGLHTTIAGKQSPVKSAAFNENSTVSRFHTSRRASPKPKARKF